MHRVRMLIHFGVIPYIVFDGDYLPSKAATEIDRAARREESKRKGLELYRLNKPSQAHLELQKAVDVTPEMARQFIDELKKTGVQYVVAPYEADAQLVYLERKGLIQGILSEDSDLLVFGAQRLLTKLDQYGECVEINRADFTACREICLVGWSDAEFRRMAILSGCDYLASIHKMGLKTAYRYVRKYKTIEKIVRMLQFDGQYRVPLGYLESFHRAELTFLHQRVYCPLIRDVVTMTEIGSEAQSEDLSFIGARLEQDIARGVAVGDLDPMTKVPIRVHGVSNTTPNKLLTNHREDVAGTIPAVKVNKSIQSFFAPKRVPLAELDPNRFTPSPSQERLLRQANEASWISSSVRSEIPRPQPSTSVSSPKTLQAISKSEVIDKPSSIKAQPTSTKRRRLCLDPEEDKKPGSVGGDQEVRSHFFVSNAKGLKPTCQNSSAHKKSKHQSINIWSEDSIEKAMVDLPDAPEVSASSKSRIMAGCPNNRGVTVEREERDSNQTSQLDRNTREDSQTPISSKGVSQSDVSTAASTTCSAPSAARTFDRYVTAELSELTEKFSYRPELKVTVSEEELRKSTSTESLKVSSPKLPSMGRRSMTPLQRLGVGALNRSRSCNHLAASNLPTNTHDIKPTYSSGDENDLPTHVPRLPFTHSIGPDAFIGKGSEDAMIPDSEEEANDALSDGEERSKQTAIDFGCFAFTG